MVPIKYWNPILVRLYEKTRDFDMSTNFADVAEIIGVTRHDLSNWTGGVDTKGNIVAGKCPSGPKIHQLLRFS